MKIYEDQIIWTGYIKYTVDNITYFKAVALNTSVEALKEELDAICNFYTNYFADERGLDVEVTSSIYHDLTVKNGYIAKRRKSTKYESPVTD